MSKLDAQRAMREAKYARDRARAQERAPSGGARPNASRPPVAPPRDEPVPESSGPESSGPDTAEPTESTCGHRSMNGRTCTREAGHPQANHRYT